MTEGTSTITVSYGGKTTTFAVVITADPDQSIINYDFTKSLVDKKQGLTAVLGGGLTRDANGLSFTGVSQYAELGSIVQRNRTFEIDITTWNMQVDATSSNIRVVMVGENASSGNGLLIFRHGYGWASYISSWSDIYGTLNDKNAFANSTIKIQVGSDGSITLYLNEILVGTSTKTVADSVQGMFFGTTANEGMGGNMSNAVITGLRVYEGAV